MPQMSPMNWTFNLLFFNMIIYLMCLLIYPISSLHPPKYVNHPTLSKYSNWVW